jgi:hypothetical protein
MMYNFSSVAGIIFIESTSCTPPQSGIWDRAREMAGESSLTTLSFREAVGSKDSALLPGEWISGTT